jgi:Family of unknown function (DUF6058)
MEPIALATSPEDVAYIRASYVTLDQLARDGSERHWPGTRLPRATYRLDDGSEWYPRDWRRLHDDAGGIAALPAMFERRLRAASLELDHPVDPAEEWAAYLAGLYGACLYEVTPEKIVLKEHLIARIDHALLAPRPADRAWLGRLHADVDALDVIARPFASCDRIRFGRPTSRDRLIDGVRGAFPRAM